MISTAQLAKLSRAMPFWSALLLAPMAWFAAINGGWWLVLVPFVLWNLSAILDVFTGTDEENADPNTEDAPLFWYRVTTTIWPLIQFVTLYGILAYVARTDHLSMLEMIALFFSVGILTGTVGINYSHELMHQKPKWERWLGDILLAMVLYSHFRSEHLLVHHRYVATPKDPVTSRYNQGIHRVFPRVIWQTFISSFNAERAMLARKQKSGWDPSNPFWRYLTLQCITLGLAFAVAGWLGVALFVWQAFVAIWQLEVVNYIEHYGLTRKHLGDGKYEHVQPHHSWNASHQASNWLLINLQRHSDHHYKPDRRFPLLQTYGEDEAPQLPFGYPIMSIFAMCPPVWRRVMNPRVRAWRKQYYPEISDWHPYNKGETPMPR